MQVISSRSSQASVRETTEAKGREGRKEVDRKESWLLGLIHGYLFHLQTVVGTER